jgi:putative phage-type endonuclease
MKIYNIEQRTEEWHDLRRGRVTGTKLKDIVVLRGTNRKEGYYELMADRLATPATDENPMTRGARLEEEARATFEEKTGLVVEEIGFCTREDNENIAVSPDGLIKENGKYTQAVEIKCLSSAKHLRGYVEKEVPKEYEFQVIQNFIVNDDLERLFFVFYDPRVTSLPFHYLTVTREDLGDKIKEFREYQENVLQEVEEFCINLAF